MRRFERWAGIIVLAGLFVVAAGRVGAADKDYEDAVERWVSLSQANRLVSRFVKPEAWDVSVFLSTRTVGSIAKHYEGTKFVANQGFAKKAGLAVELGKLEFTSAENFAAGQIDVAASAAEPELSLSLTADLSLRFSRYENVDNDPKVVDLIFRYEIDALRPNYSFWQKFRSVFGSTIDKISESAGDLLTEQLEKNNPLEVRVRLPVSVDLDIDLNNEDEIEFKKGEAVIGKVNHAVIGSKSRVTRRLYYFPPIIDPKGIRLFAVLDKMEALWVPTPSRTAPAKEKIGQVVDALAKSLADRLSGLSAPESGFQMQLSDRVGRALVVDIAALPAEKRSVALATKSASGLLFDLRGRDKHFGRFGIKGEPTGANTLRGLGQITSIGAASSVAGIDLRARAEANVAAQVRTIWDGFLIKGAVKFDAQLNGSAAAAISGPLRMQLHAAEDLTGVMWGLDLRCTGFVADVRTSEGKLFGVIPVHYDEIRATFPVTLFEEKSGGGVILSSRPRRFLKFPAPGETAEQEPAVLVEAPSNAIEFKMIPNHAAFEAGYYAVRGDITSTALSVDPTAVGSDLFTDEERQSLDAAEDKLAEFRFPGEQQCPQLPTPKLEILGLDFGPEGEILAYIEAGLKTEEEKLKAFGVLLSGDLSGAGEHLEGVLKGKRDKIKAGLDAAKALAEKAKQKVQAEIERKKKDPLRPPGPAGKVHDAVKEGIKKIFSDLRLKRDLELLHRLPSGMGVYKFRYVDGTEPFVGVLAQEAVKHHPAAVEKHPNGFLMVDYGQLDVKFMPWEDWLASGGQDRFRDFQVTSGEIPAQIPSGGSHQIHKR